MFLNPIAGRLPDKIAYKMAGTEESITYSELNLRTTQGANLFRALGLATGDRVLVLLENNIDFIQVALACIRAGLYVVPAGRHLKEHELLHILHDSAAKVMVTSTACVRSLRSFSPPSTVQRAYVVDGPFEPYQDWQSAVSMQSTEEQESPILGAPLVYSSGTTGQPKGIITPLTEAASAAWRGPLKRTFRDEIGLSHGEHDVNLVTGPLYHIAPLNYAFLSLKRSATAVIMERFDAEWALMLIEQHRVSHVQMVPTMLARILMLEPGTREQYDVSSLRHVEHNSAPCPIHVKEQLIEWLGPIIYEDYGASEPAGGTFISSSEWLLHKGSVGRPILNGKLHILDENEQELPPFKIGEVFFSGVDTPFEYLNGSSERRGRVTSRGYVSFGDIGYVDDDGYLYLVDRKQNMIIVGGNNVYPLEIENYLMTHPYVADAAVIGVPDPIFGERAVAFVKLRDQRNASRETEEALVAYCEVGLSDFKCPKAIEFVSELPRTEHGKLLKRYLRESRESQ